MKLTPEQVKIAHELTASEVNIAELLAAIHKHGNMLLAWFESPALAIVPPDHREARILDFQKPLASWNELHDLICQAEERAEATMKAMAAKAANGGTH